MSQASERELFVRSLGGDWRSRVDFYKKFIHDNSRVRRLGSTYPVVDDFLHDCFSNILRTGRSFTGEGRLDEWVESVAVWTALERGRLRAKDVSGAGKVVRMCAAVESDEAADRARIAAYAPPRLGPEDSLSSRIAALLGEPAFILLRTMAAEKASWADAATTSRKPVNILGPVLVRAVDRFSRFFGAPPPLNDDLEPVFSDVSATEAAAAGKADPTKPNGRVISMQLDPAFYKVTPEMRSIGLSVPYEVRTIALWDAARISAPPGEALREHLAKCNYCSDVLRSLLLMQQALLSGAKAEFLLCPGASTLVKDEDEAQEAVHQHQAECTLCRAERMRALGSEERGIEQAPRAASGEKPGKKIAWVAATGVILAVVFVAGLRYFSPKPKDKAIPVPAVTVAEPPPFAFNTKYLDLAQRVPFDGQRLMAAVLPGNQFMVMEAMADLTSGKVVEAKIISERVANLHNDPGAQMLYAVCLYQGSATSEGYRAMQKAEAMPPRDSFRCWSTLQCALMAGDRTVAEREVAHLSSDPEFGARANGILAQMRARK